MYIDELIEKLNSKGITPKPSTIISYEPSTNAEIMISSNNMHMQKKIRSRSFREDIYKWFWKRYC